MKKLLINTALLVLLIGSFSSCKKKLEDDYLNPELTTTGSIGKLFSGMFMNKRIHPSYWDYYTFIAPTTAAFSQFTTISPGAQMYTPNTSYTEGRWVDFYNGSVGDDYNYNGPGILNSYVEMQTSLAALSSSQQDEQRVFLKCAQVLVYDQAAQMIDLWGDIPFSKASSLNTSGRTVILAPYDNAAALYDTLIAGLKTVNTYLDTVHLVKATSAEFTKQDILFNGNLSMWRRYANSLRLRLLMRISNVSEASAKTEVTAMLADATTYPLITDNSQNALFKMSPTAVRSDLHDVFADFGFAPDYLMNTLMRANSDPRTEVYWDQNDTTGWRGVPFDVTAGDYNAGGYATYDSATFFYNDAIPAVLFTASEVSFLKAEADERWGISSAQTDYEAGINQSVGFWFGINQLRTPRNAGNPRSWATLVTPDAATISAYVAKPAIAYTGTTDEKLAKIYTQKWMHFFILQAGQAWAELRRTDYPVLQFGTLSSAVDKAPPTRLLYPSSEKLYNTANYSAVEAKDTKTTRIFWDAK
ncbi:SusD/RagB family nutrient-binding outer membrane lipoprotein [Chitinophaga oryziterrae]|uniref:SusD/RagB family nutrient-binding outer membrane lipoprotein n=1 Tax=Chitinophaga oryziterrae TaxID=1031224 RepID=A0A6N8J6U7_9BACT|nr:SusD/RagB family nutrient-binding outer membrane lipoprotein [Chitinophaga oryziterrae]MVT40930.1 SusD/RagB family nutrient-binding outer membrane lipoprotein [Chitinophaga oryziterrae]